MIRKGFYGIYHGIEYEITEDMNDNLQIKTEDKSKITSDFEDTYNSGLFTKTINKSELSEFYYIIPRAEYKGEKFNVSTRHKDNLLLLGTKDANLAKKLGFERTDKYYYEKWVPVSEVKLIEEKEHIK